MPIVPIAAINGKPPGIQPTAGGYTLTKADLYSDSTERSAETGRLIPYLIRRDVCTIEVEYLASSAEIKALERLIAPEGGVRQYPVTFYDDDSGEYITRTMYPSDRVKNTEMIQGGVPRVRLSFSLIEL